MFVVDGPPDGYVVPQALALAPPEGRVYGRLGRAVLVIELCARARVEAPRQFSG